MISTDTTTHSSQPQAITDIDRLMRRSDKKTPQSSESLFKAAITGVERSFRRPGTPSPALHLWTATGYRFFQDANNGLAGHVDSLPYLWDQVLPVLVADTRATRLAHGGVLFMPASRYREDPDDEYGCWFASVVALDGHGFVRRAGCPVAPNAGGFRRLDDWYITDTSLHGDDEQCSDDPSRVIHALAQQERSVTVPGLREVANG